VPQKFILPRRLYAVRRAALFVRPTAWLKSGQNGAFVLDAGAQA
jgi:hypothetical protein